MYQVFASSSVSVAESLKTMAKVLTYSFIWPLWLFHSTTLHPPIVAFLIYILSSRKEMKVVLTLAVVNGTFVFCWLPHFIGIMCLTFTSGSCPFSDNFFTTTTVLAMLNSGCNPFIYTLTYRRFRKAFKQVLPFFRSNRSRNIDSPTK